ncbi:hypothetical protein VB796_06455 [Arcicella sp. LKC2W]|uniref:hypothetical protein n=1 Tax=Arcicella sp. LKC2W TaxID=2984198 RepID=UPI002B211A73|nr:hypothetical protein [Arcicella sp. LKC2W]MEA5458668.1 hypothetical protein [Arcicella sp. LKC2W]
MLIEVAVTPVNEKFIRSKHPDNIKIGRHSLFFMIYLAQRKFRDGHESTKTKIPLVKPKKLIVINQKQEDTTPVIKYSSKITFKCSAVQWLRLCLKGPETVIVITSFNRIIRDFFYQDFFNYMNLRVLAKELLTIDSQEIKGFALEYMQKLRLSDDDIMLETLLRNYRRYRLNPNLDLYELIESLND